MEDILNNKIYDDIEKSFLNFNNFQCKDCDLFSFPCLLNEQKNIFLENSNECYGSKKFIQWCHKFF